MARLHNGLFWMLVAGSDATPALAAWLVKMCAGADAQNLITRVEQFIARQSLATRVQLSYSTATLVTAAVHDIMS